ncbi:MAG: hypothetical protein ACYC2K_13195, partial [Gemmatimonadales bacterium]
MRLFTITPQPGSTAPRAVTLDPVPYGTRDLTVVTGSRLLVGATDRFGFEQIDLGTNRLRSVRIDAPVRPLDRGLVEQAATQILLAYRGLAGEQYDAMHTRLVEAALASVPTLPPIERIVGTASGEIWLEETATDPAAPIRYVVLDSTGAWRGMVVGPPRFQLTWIGAESVLGTWLDPDDVAHVREYRLIPVS